MWAAFIAPSRQWFVAVSHARTAAIAITELKRLARENHILQTSAAGMAGSQQKDYVELRFILSAAEVLLLRCRNNARAKMLIKRKTVVGGLKEHCESFQA